MKIQWGNWDPIQEFNLIESACLWLEIDPSEGDNDLHPKAILIEKKMAQIDACHRQIRGLPKYHKIEINPRTGSEIVTLYRVGYVFTRQELIAVAEHLGERPKFLYPEERDPPKALSEGQLHGRERESLYKIIHALFHMDPLDPNDPKLVGKLKIRCQLDDETIRKHLKAAGIPIRDD